MLYISAGDGASFNCADYGQEADRTTRAAIRRSATLTAPTAQGGALRSQ